MVGFGGGQVIRLASPLILSRLLFEEAFGLMALCNVLVAGLQLFSDIGLGPSIIQNRRGNDPSFLHTAFTMQAARGLLLWLVACALTIPFARFYGDPLLAGHGARDCLHQRAAGVSVDQGVHRQPRAGGRPHQLARDLSQMAGTAVMVGWAYLTARSGHWWRAPSSATSSRRCSATRCCRASRDRLRWNRADAREIFRFGRWIFLSTVFTFLAGQSDRLIFGKLVPLGLLGVYGIALMIALLPSQALYQMTSSIHFPAVFPGGRSGRGSGGGDAPHAGAR